MVFSRILLKIFIISSTLIFISSYPIEIKNIEHIFPPQSTIVDSNGKLVTNVDKQIEDSKDNEEPIIKKDCIKKTQTEQLPSQEGIAEFESFLSNLTSIINNFNDTTPLNGTVVDDPMEVKIYKPECDD